MAESKAPSPTAGKRTAEDFRRVFDAVDAEPFPDPDELERRFRAKYNDPPRTTSLGYPYSPGVESSWHYAQEDGRYINIRYTVDDVVRAAKSMMMTPWFREAIANAEAEGRFHEEGEPKLHRRDYSNMRLAMLWYVLENGLVDFDEEGRKLGFADMDFQSYAGLSVIFHLSENFEYDMFENFAKSKVRVGLSKMQALPSPILDGDLDHIGGIKS